MTPKVVSFGDRARRSGHAAFKAGKRTAGKFRPIPSKPAQKVEGGKFGRLNAGQKLGRSAERGNAMTNSFLAGALGGSVAAAPFNARSSKKFGQEHKANAATIRSNNKKIKSVSKAFRPHLITDAGTKAGKFDSKKHIAVGAGLTGLGLGGAAVAADSAMRRSSQKTALKRQQTRIKNQEKKLIDLSKSSVSAFGISHN